LNTELKNDIEKKYENKKKFLLDGLKRAIIEEEIHLKQKTHARYRYLDSQYGQNDDWDMRPMLSSGRPNRETL
jgi:hypothetical protein